MRKFLLIASLLMGVTSFAQNTTDEEYNYMNKGLQIQIESGLDMKKGYVLSKEIGHSCYNRDCSGMWAFSLLLRDKDKSIAGIIVWVTYSGGRRVYLGIPFEGTNNKGLIERVWEINNRSYVDCTNFMSVLMLRLPELMKSYYTNSLELED